MTRLLALAVALVCLAQPPIHAQPRSAEALARALEERYRGITDFSATFTQTYRGGFLTPLQSHETGSLRVKRPGRMRWVYEKPERKELIATGETVYTYLPSERQVHVMPQDQTSAPAMFLAGQGDILRDFQVELTDPPIADTIALKLTPRTPELGYAHLIVALDPASLQIRALVTSDSQGAESTMVFSSLRENRGIADREFEFQPPRGFDIIEEGRLR